MTAWTVARRAVLMQMAQVTPTQDLVVIGAVAVGHHLGAEFRTTLDLDLCVATSLTAMQPPATWKHVVAHRWKSDQGMTVDLLPVDADSLRQGAIVWPDGSRLELAGIDLAMRDATPIGHGLPNRVKVASLRALFLCKTIAWTDRPGDRRKDLGDLAEILERYVERDDARCFDDVAIPHDLDLDERAAFLLGVDLSAVCEAAHRTRLASFLARMGDANQSPYALMAGRWPRDYEALGRKLAALRAGLGM